MTRTVSMFFHLKTHLRTDQQLHLQLFYANYFKKTLEISKNISWIRKIIFYLFWVFACSFQEKGFSRLFTKSLICSYLPSSWKRKDSSSSFRQCVAIDRLNFWKTFEKHLVATLHWTCNKIFKNVWKSFERRCVREHSVNLINNYHLG